MFTYIIITSIDCLVNHHFLSYILHTALRWRDIVNIVNIEGIKLSCLSDILRLRILPLLDGWLVELSFCCWLASIFFIALALISNSRSSSFCLFIGLIFAPVIENVNTTYPIEQKPTHEQWIYIACVDRNALGYRILTNWVNALNLIFRKQILIIFLQKMTWQIWS